MAGTNLYLATSKIWDYFFENIDRLQDNEDCIAENPDNGMSLYLTANTIFPQLVLYSDDHPTLFRFIRSREECSKWAVFMITKFVDGIPTEGVPEDRPNIIELPMAESAREAEPVRIPDDDYEDYEDEEEQRILDTIYQREDELTKAMGDCLAVILCEGDYNAVVEGYGEKFINEIVDDFLQYLYDNHMVTIYRPTLEYDEETGCEILKEFPYGWGEDYEVE